MQKQLLFWSVVAGVVFALLANESNDPMVKEYMVTKAKMNMNVVAAQK